MLLQHILLLLYDKEGEKLPPSSGQQFLQAMCNTMMFFVYDNQGKISKKRTLVGQYFFYKVFV